MRRWRPGGIPWTWYLPNVRDVRWAYADLRGALGGWCHHRPYDHLDPDTGRRGGYAWWRCTRRRGHHGMHRMINYVWDEHGTETYAPVPNRAELGRDVAPEPMSPWPARIHGPSYLQRIHAGPEKARTLDELAQRRRAS